MSSTHRHLLLDFFWQVISGPPCIKFRQFNLIRSRDFSRTRMRCPTRFNKHTWAFEKIQRHFAKFLIFNETDQYPPRGLQQEALLECVPASFLASRWDFAKIKFLSDVLSYSVECPYLLSKLLLRSLLLIVESVKLLN
jgi:hypothetical protein